MSSDRLAELLASVTDYRASLANDIRSKVGALDSEVRALRQAADLLEGKPPTEEEEVSAPAMDDAERTRLRDYIQNQASKIEELRRLLEEKDTVITNQAEELDQKLVRIARLEKRISDMIKDAEAGVPIKPPKADEIVEAPPPKPPAKEVKGDIPPPPPPADGAKDMPEHLRIYPAAQTGAQRSVRLKVAQAQYAVHDELRRQEMSVPALSKKLKMNGPIVSGYLRDMAEVDLVMLAGGWDQGPTYRATKPGEKMQREYEGILAEMPASQADTPFAVKWTTCYQQAEIVDAAQRYRRPFVLPEFIKWGRFDWPDSRVKDYVRDLAEQGKFIKPTGLLRRAKGQTAGRTAYEYIAIQPDDAPPEEAEPEAEEPEAEEPQEAEEAPRRDPGSAADLLARCRDIVVKKRTPFSAQEIADEMGGIPLPLVTTLLGLLRERQVVQQNEDGDLWRYIPPDDEGAGARIDRQRRPAPPERTAREAVAGTGKGPKLTDPDVRGLCNAIEKAGGQWSFTPSGHIEVTGGGLKKRVLISNTPRSPRTVMNDRARLRREGLAI